jgi:RHS repeat-associated protein
MARSPTAGYSPTAWPIDRYLWGPGVDMLLADESVSDPATAGNVFWMLGDDQNTVRDVVQYNSGTDSTSVVDHNTYDAFGNKLSQSNAANDVLFSYTGKYLDVDTGLQWNGERWYDANTGRWMNQDPIGFNGGKRI